MEKTRGQTTWHINIACSTALTCTHVLFSVWLVSRVVGHCILSQDNVTQCVVVSCNVCAVYRVVKM